MLPSSSQTRQRLQLTASHTWFIFQQNATPAPIGRIELLRRKDVNHTYIREVTLGAYVKLQLTSIEIEVM